MTKNDTGASPDSITRRRFIATTSVGAALPLATSALGGIPVMRKDEIRVGVIGCGGRGTGAAMNALQASPDVRIHALGDLFADRMTSSRDGLRGQVERYGDRASVPDENCFAGWDAYQDVIATDCDYVILATPPGFRPQHFEAAIAAGKHVFMEKPVAVDPVGIRKVLAAARSADDQKLSVVAGTQRRHEKCYLEMIDRIRNGAIGTPLAARCYWNQSGLWSIDARADRSDMENQLRNWLYHTWLSGDHIVEQHVHNMDVVNWVYDAHPTEVYGVGGRQARTDPKYGHIYDHFSLEYSYPGNRFAHSMCRQQEGTPGRVEERITGTEGHARSHSGMAEILGPNAWRFEGRQTNPYVQEHMDLQASMRGDTARLNEGQRIAESTMTAIMGREAAYTGQLITWDEAMASTLDLSPLAYEFSERTVHDVAIPGVTELNRTV
ncbi:MAG: oxidoreductase [Phycisphaerae bacterium]|nr:oxidoreductase [Phycisphaerae bacterium]HAW94771.1 oxidoreductase [Phycisphaerales bacterium]